MGGPVEAPSLDYSDFALSHCAAPPLLQKQPKVPEPRGMDPYEPLSKLLVSPLITPVVVPYIIPYITPFKEFRL